MEVPSKINENPWKTHLKPTGNPSPPTNLPSSFYSKRLRDQILGRIPWGISSFPKESRLVCPKISGFSRTNPMTWQMGYFDHPSSEFFEGKPGFFGIIPAWFQWNFGVSE